MTAFAEEQTKRDEILFRAIADGHFTVPGIADECRRWSTCDRCRYHSGEMRFLSEQQDWEGQHILFGCAAKAEPEPIDIDLNLWPYPAEWTFTRELKPLLTVHVTRRTSHEFTSHRTPAVLRKNAA